MRWDSDGSLDADLSTAHFSEFSQTETARPISFSWWYSQPVIFLNITKLFSIDVSLFTWNIRYHIFTNVQPPLCDSCWQGRFPKQTAAARRGGTVVGSLVGKSDYCFRHHSWNEWIAMNAGLVRRRHCNPQVNTGLYRSPQVRLCLTWLPRDIPAISRLLNGRRQLLMRFSTSRPC